MITEQYVTFETAKMLKEAGFDEICDTFYSSAEGAPYLLRSHNIELDKKHYSRPTQALAARWIREIHKICLILTPMSDGWMYDLYDLKKYQYIILSKDAGIVTYETAFEEALQEALRLIIKP